MGHISAIAAMAVGGILVVWVWLIKFLGNQIPTLSSSLALLYTKLFLDELFLKTILSRWRYKMSSHRNTDRSSQDPPLLDSCLGAQPIQGRDSYGAPQIAEIELGVFPSDRS